MKKMRINIMSILFIGILLIISGCSNNENTKIRFADEGWDSVRFHNEVARFILEEGYGYETEQQNGSTAAIWKSLEEGAIDVHLEAWTANLGEIYTDAIDSGNVEKLAVNFDDNFQGLYVPTYIIEGDEERGIEPVAPELKYITDLPDYWEIFKDPENDEIGRIIGAIPGWSVDEIFFEGFELYDLDDTYDYFRPGSEAAINTSLMKAYEAGEPWLGYNYEPNWIMGLYDMTPLQEKDPEGPFTSVGAQDINVVAHKDLAERAPDAVEFLEKYQTSSTITSDALAYIQEDSVSEKDAALAFLKDNQDIWTTWVTKEAAEKVKDAL